VGQGPIVGRVIEKGLAGDQLSDRMYLVIDGSDARPHYVEMANAEQAEEARVGSIVEVGRTKIEARPADRNILAMTSSDDRVYRPSQHLAVLRASHTLREGNEEGFVEAHVRRLEALRRAGIVERIDADRWRIPEDYAQRAQDYDSGRSRQLAVRVLSIIDLDSQVSANGATVISSPRIPCPPEMVALAEKCAMHWGAGGSG